jgi:hypothetical protein
LEIFNREKLNGKFHIEDLPIYRFTRFTRLLLNIHPITLKSPQMAFNFAKFYIESQQILKTVIVKTDRECETFLAKKAIFATEGISYKEKDQVVDGVILTKNQIKYTGACRFTSQWNHACRGTTLIRIDGNLRAIVPCFNKFFNLGEIKNQYGITWQDMPAILESQGFKLILMNKEDGSNIKTFYDEWGNLHSYTLGSVDPTIKMQGSMDESPTFSGMSIKLLEIQYPQILAYLKLHPYVSLVSELKSRWNVIVTEYTYDDNHGMMTPLAMIGLDGIPEWSTLRKLCPDMFDSNGYPKSVVPTSASTFEADRETFMAHLNSNPSLYGNHPEGFVGYACTLGFDGLPDKCYPWCKDKDESYLALHRKMCLNPGASKDLMSVQILHINDQCDDEKDCLGKDLRDTHVKIFREALIVMADDLSQISHSLFIKSSNPKDYAEVVNSIPNSLWWMRSHLFKLRTSLKVENESDFEAIELIYQILKSPAKTGADLSRLQDLQASDGVTWWKKDSKVTSVPVTNDPVAKTKMINLIHLFNAMVLDEQNDIDKVELAAIIPLLEGIMNKGKSRTLIDRLSKWAQSDLTPITTEAVAMAMTVQEPTFSLFTESDVQAPALPDSVEVTSPVLQLFDAVPPLNTPIDIIDSVVRNGFLVITDFDHSFAETSVEDHSVFDSDPSVCTPIMQTVNMLRGYQIMGAKIYCVTGRDHSLVPSISQWIAKILGYEISVIGKVRSEKIDGDNILKYKVDTITDLLNLNPDVETVVHIEDDTRVLNEVADVVNAQSRRYLGIQVQDSKLVNVITSKHRPIIVTLVQPPASGKSTILKSLNEYYSERGFKTAYMSPDLINRELRKRASFADKSVKIPGNIMYAEIMRAFRNGVTTSDIFFIDMCHDSSGILKDMYAFGATLVCGSFMKLRTVKTKKATKQDIDPSYANFLLENARARVAKKVLNVDSSVPMNGSTLDDNTKILDVLTKKTTGCINQLSLRSIKLYDPSSETPIMPLDQCIELMKVDIDLALTGGSSNSRVTGAYVGFPVKLDKLKRLESHYDVKYPHITMIPPTSSLIECLPSIGLGVTIKVLPIVETANTLVHPALWSEELTKSTNEDQVRHGHITRQVRHGHAPVEAGRELQQIKSAVIDEIVSDRYLSYSIFM